VSRLIRTTVRNESATAQADGSLLKLLKKLTPNPDARLVMYGQELNPESYAICKADMLIKGQDIANIVFGKDVRYRPGRTAAL